MLEDVLAALAEAPASPAMLVTRSIRSASDLARRYGARVVDRRRARRPYRRGHGGGAHPGGGGRGGMLTLPGDIPRVTAAEIERAARGAPAGARRSRSRRRMTRRGSNAVLCSPPMVMPLRFGDDSFLPHLAAARALGIEPTIVKLPGIGWISTSPRICRRCWYRLAHDNAGHEAIGNPVEIDGYRCAPPITVSDATPPATATGYRPWTTSARYNCPAALSTHAESGSVPANIAGTAYVTELVPTATKRIAPSQAAGAAQEAAAL